MFGVSSEYWSDIKKIPGGCKNGTDILYLHAKFGGDPPLYGGVRKKSWEFLFFLFVTLWILNLNKGLAHQSDIVICAHHLFRRRIEQNSTIAYYYVIVDVHVYKIFPITDFIAAL